MKKEKIIVREYNSSDNIDRLINLIRDISKNTRLEGCFIYYASQYNNYLIKESVDDNVLLTVIEVYGLIVGVAHFVINGNELFLNNISIHDDFLGKGYGGILLKKSVEMIVDHKDMVLGLHVFKSNIRAMHWYLSLGFIVVRNYNNWYKIIPKKSAINRSNDMQKDNNGFVGIYVDNERICTVVNDCLIVHNVLLLPMINYTNFSLVSNGDITIINKADFNVSFIDSSIYLQLSVKTLLDI